MNWDDVRVFLAVYRAGTLRGAATLLAIDQTTVGRRLSTLERQLGSKLFLRTTEGLVMTATGQEILVTAQEIERLAVSFERRSEGADERIAGEVRVTTTDALAVDFLVPAIERLRLQHPEIRVILSTTTRLLDLGRREADIAVRTLRPEQPDLIVKKLESWQVGLYATKAYIARHGQPTEREEFAGHDIALYQAGVTDRQSATLVGNPRHKGRIVAELDSSFMLATFIRAGLALGELPDYLAQQHPELIRLLPHQSREKPYEVWLVMHQDLAHTARVKAVMKVIAEAFQKGGHLLG